MLTLIGKTLFKLGIALAGGKLYKGKKNPVDHVHWR